MHRLLPFTLLAFACGCSCGERVVVYDVFQPDTHPQADALHTYASHALVPLRLRALDPFLDVTHIAAPQATGSISLDPDTDVNVDDDNALVFAVRTGDAGDGTLTFVDDSGGEVAARTLAVEDAASVAFAVTAPATPGLELPDVDVADVRIYAGGRAAFRTTLTNAGGDELVGLDATTSGALPEGLTTRNGSGCAADTCDAVRNAFEIALTAATADASDIAVAAGAAAATLHVVPVADSDISDVVLDEADLQNGKGSLVAHVLAGTAPVFGAPVTWDIDGAPLVDEDADPPAPQAGDALQFDAPAPSADPSGVAAHDVAAHIAGHEAAASVRGDAFSATSITAACGAAPASTAPVWAAAVLLAATLRTRMRNRCAETAVHGQWHRHVS